MMKKKVMPLSCLMAVAMLAGCGTAAPAVPEETTAPAAEIAEAVQETAPANDAESEAAAVEETAGVWQVEPCYNFDEIVPLLLYCGNACANCAKNRGLTPKTYPPAFTRRLPTAWTWTKQP